MTDSLPYRRKEVIGDAVLYLGDCREILPTLGKVDAVVTDPPYGVGFADWDSAAVMDWLPAAEEIAPTVMVCTGIKNAFQWRAPKWIAAYSFPNGEKRSVGGGINSWEPVLIYGKNPLPLDHKQFPPIASEKIDGHPCPKPLEPFKWMIRTGFDADALICDPFMGSGTTGVACAKLGRRFIGIEIDEGYFEIACERIRKAYAQPDFFVAPPAEKPKQEAFEL